ncbi:MAG: RNA methyltransferase [Bacteroidales bacterium]|nr:RNA methyltransferase [Bacteroidales bacterium]
MLSKNQIKFIQSLQLKKHRNETGLFVAEGNKLVSDMLLAFDCHWLIATSDWFKINNHSKAELIIEASSDDLRKASSLTTPQDVIAIFKKPNDTLPTENIAEQLLIAADCIQDPGNLGTIIRLADWFGIEHIICSLDCADVYNSKTIQATMGALSRVKVHYTPLDEFLARHKQSPIYGTFLDGDDIYQNELTANGIIVMGNEGNGISHEIEKLVNKRIYIPNFPAGSITSESLNVAVATAIVCAEFRRRVR